MNTSSDQGAPELPKRLREGRYKVWEVIKILSTLGGEDPFLVGVKLEKAIVERRLPVYLPGRNMQYFYEHHSLSNETSVINPDYEEMYWSDLNDWLEREHPLVEYRFPNPESIKSKKNFVNNNQVDGLNNQLNGLNKKQIMAAEWSFEAGFDIGKLSVAMSNTYKWIEPAKVIKGNTGRGGSAWWNPAIMAECLMVNGYALKVKLTKTIDKSFGKWKDDWERILEKHSNYES